VSAVADHDDGPPVSGEIEALLTTISAYKRDNARLRAEVDALRRGLPDDDTLQPLKTLVDDIAGYERARRAAGSGLLQAEQHGARWFSSQRWVREWRRITGR
jgi:hypothetical protein